jgi:deoxyribodipyrimidine photolyase-related protein
MTTLCFLLGDQLSPDISALQGVERDDAVILMAEVEAEATYVRHHKKKLAFVFSAMRHFAAEMKAAGWRVDYVRLDDPENTGSLTGELARAVRRHAPSRIVVTLAGEHRVVALQRGFAEAMGLEVELRPDDRFICSQADFNRWADRRGGRLLMEAFYRDMRRRTGLLMDAAGKPEGGRWNFDKDNRNPARESLFMPEPLAFAPDAITSNVLALVERRFADHFGSLEPFDFAVTRRDAERAFAHFLKESLPDFGRTQDAMLEGARVLNHARIALYLNVGLLDPLDVCRRAQAEWTAGRAPLNSVEGFIRQILGWREYARGIYFREGPDYVRRNALDARQPLPAFYWTGETDMNCLRHCIAQTREDAYAHHIQRLMVTGNFALIAGLDPHEVHEWYLTVYADAYEWVEAPNTLGMSLFADGGLLATKPYAASGAYINRMSDYCGRCRYDVTARTGADACPFNALYWDFIARNETVIRANPRLGFAARTWEKFSEDEQAAIRQRAADILSSLEPAYPTTPSETTSSPRRH